jgi:hypothetical protein
MPSDLEVMTRFSFNCGKPDLDDWLKTKAGQQERANNTRTWVKGREAPVMSEAKSARINLRLNPESLETIRAAASVQQQDLTSFVLGAAMERARAVLCLPRTGFSGLRHTR